MEYTYPMAITVIGTVSAIIFGVVNVYGKKEIGITPATFHEHFNGLEQKVMTFFSEIKDMLHDLENRLGQTEKEVRLRAEVAARDRADLLQELRGKLNEIMTGGD